MKAERNSQTITRTVFLLIAACLIAVPVQGQYGGGSGTADDPYQIWTAEQMNAIGAEPNDWDKHFKLMADIDLSAYDGQDGRPAFNIIAPDTNMVEWGFQGTPFAGIFDGDGHTISSFSHRSRRRDYIGLFGYVTGPGVEIRELGLTDLAVEDEEGRSVGGLVGYNEGTVAGCYGSGVVSGQYDVGGLVGANTGIMTRCHYSGQVRGKGSVGGVAGATGENDGCMTYCYSVGTVSGQESGVGGLVGQNYGDVSDCSSSAAANGSWAVGGLVGWNDEGVITRCYSSGEVNGTWAYVGGLVGYNMIGAITCCYSIGAVYGDRKCSGGLVGFDDFGWSSGGIVSHCFWDVQTSGQVKSDGGKGQTTPQMRSVQIYLNAGWDFVGELENGTCEMWQMAGGGGYPVLAALSGYVPPRLSGSGTPEDPYLISDALDLGAIVHYSGGAHYRLSASIDLAGIRWGVPVIPRFAGTFDGDGMTISHLTVAGERYVGLFGRLESGALVRDLGVVDVNISGGEDYVGALAGDASGAITGCHSRGMVGSDGKYVGGLVGRSSGDVTDCHSEGVVSGSGETGGLLGMNAAGRVTRCYNVGAVKWRKIDDNQRAVGGLMGANGNGVVTQCYNGGTVSGGSRYTGGLVGNSSGHVTDCYNTGKINSTGENVGGLAGLNSGTLTTCYSSGAISGTGQDVGGLVGRGWASSRSGTNHVGEVINSFWDTEASDWTTSDGGTGKRTAEMQTGDTFVTAGWDFVGEADNGTEDVWWIDEGKDYPRLWWEAAAPPPL